MLSKEEIENNLKAISSVMLNFDDKLCDDMQERVKIVKEYIEQLETDKQKLIEKLETDIEIARREYRITLSDRQDGIRQEAQEILELMKGEKE